MKKIQPDHASASGSPSTPDQVRCVCGGLLARRLPNGVELKCRRCKRVVMVWFDEEVPNRA